MSAKDGRLRVCMEDEVCGLKAAIPDKTSACFGAEAPQADDPARFRARSLSRKGRTVARRNADGQIWQACNQPQAEHSAPVHDFD